MNEFTLKVQLTGDPHTAIIRVVFWTSKWTVIKELHWSNGLVNHPRQTHYRVYSDARITAIRWTMKELGLKWPNDLALPTLDDLRMLCSVTVVGNTY